MYYQFRPYVSVAKRRQRALSEMSKLRKKGTEVQPIEIEGRLITRTFWGNSWCEHMESLGDFANRLPRGRTYVRNGSVCHLAIERGKVAAIVSGSELYNVNVTIKELRAASWRSVKKRTSGQIGSLIELLQGKFSDNIMKVVTDPRSGMFPLKKEISYRCSCPDWASMCKHVAAVLYGVGARLDAQPELLFMLRGVDHEELITAPTESSVAAATKRGGRRRTVASADLADVFGIDMADEEGTSETQPLEKGRKSRKTTTQGKAAKPKGASRPAAKSDPKRKKKAKSSIDKKSVRQTAAAKKKSNVKKKRAAKKKTAKTAARSTAGR